MKYFQPKLLCSLSAAPLILVISCQILLITSDQVKMNDDEPHCSCRVTYKAVGCEIDKANDRALPEMLLNERDKYSPYYDGFDVDWANWDEYLPAFTCRCAEAAMTKGYKYFGLQNWAECWSGPSPAADTEYDKHGPGEECFDPEYQKCAKDSPNCVGDESYNFVYKIQYFDCSKKFKRVGCYKDNGNRPLTDLILTDREKDLPVSSGRHIDWYHFDLYLPDFACRCAMKTVEKGWSTFGIQYYGECWSGKDGGENYAKYGNASTCVNKCYEPCHGYDPFCAGMGNTNFVYRII